MKKKTLGSLIFALAIALTLAYAQEAGTIRGKVVDTASGDPIIGVNVIVKDRQVYAVTDINGAYILSGVPTGEQVILFQMMGYSQTESRITVMAGENDPLNIVLTYKTAEEVVVTAKRISNTEAALLSKRKKAAVAQDAISSEQISKTPDSDAGEAAKRVTGVSVVDGKYIWVRGLDERYSSVFFSNSIIPSPDPEKKIVPLDIFPVGLLDNLIVIKSYTPDMPGEFGSGLVQINPRDYPESRFVTISVGSGWQIGTTNAKFLTYKGGDWDWFGVDDGTREMPKGISDKPLGSSTYTAAKTEKIGEDFSNVYTPTSKKGELPSSFSLTYGDRYDLGKFGTIGLIFSTMFKESSKTVEYDIRRVNRNFVDLKNLETIKSTYSTTKGLLLSLGYNPSRNHKLRLTSYYTHSSKDSTSIEEGFLSDRNQSADPLNLDVSKNYKLQFVNTGLFYSQLSGEHHIEKAADMIIGWEGTYSFATYDEPDTRTTELLDSEGDGNFFLRRADYVKRLFNEHEETVVTFSPDLILPFKQWDGLQSKVKVGGSFTYRERDAGGRIFTWENGGVIGSYPVSGTPVEDLFTSDHIVGSSSDVSDVDYMITESSGVNNTYGALLYIYGAFAQLDLLLIRDLRLVTGVRYEYADLSLESYDPYKGGISKQDENPYARHNYMPALSLTWEFVNDMNLRWSFSKTVVRPDFRECTNTKYNTLVSGETINGNPDLKQADVYSADMRYEWFPSASEIIAVSFFYKYLLNPIEMLQTAGTGGTEFRYQNAEYAHNLGIELEAKKDLSFITKALKDLSIGVNVAYIYSRIHVEDLPTADYTTENRALQGQSPYVVNASLEYSNDKAGFTGTVLFNINGRRIVRVGIQGNGDVYEETVPKLDLVLKQKIDKCGQFKLTFKNLIDEPIEETQEQKNSITGKRKTFVLKKYREGRSIGLGYSYTF
ncbi:MAG TPA: TonB-dependent receptor [Spirochaetota bacterium]|nr:TonB-dependent receptor [Spirochaetota bacterium]HPI89254.1 TonB-dependent receptor [Spirochaetota bacterium]HPR48586.1 TonB-dependent receptor [Spirochaetota bacterium]